MTINLKVQTQTLREKGSSIKRSGTHIAGLHDNLIQIIKELDYHVKQNVSYNIADCLHLLQDNYNLVGEYGRQIMDAAEAYDRREEELHKMFEQLEIETLCIDVKGTQEIEKEQSKQPKAVMATLDKNFTKSPRDLYDDQNKEISKKETSREEIRKILEQIPELQEINYDMFSDNEQVKRIQEYIRSKGYKIMMTSKLDYGTKFALVSMGIDISFLQEDSYRGDGLNLYAYVANNPVNYIDPSGYGKEKGSLTAGRQDINRIFTGSQKHILSGGGSTSNISEVSKVLKDMFDKYSIDAGFIDIDPQTGLISVNSHLMDEIGLNKVDDLTRLNNHMVGTKYHLNINTGMISYNGKSTNNTISEESQWGIKYKYDLGEMKQIRIEAKNIVDKKLISQGIDLNHRDIQNTIWWKNFYEHDLTTYAAWGWDLGSVIGVATYRFFEYGGPSNLYGAGAMALGELVEGIRNFYTDPGATGKVSHEIDHLNTVIKNYWNNYSKKIDDIISNHSNKNYNTLNEKYLDKAILDYSNNLKSVRWRY